MGVLKMYRYIIQPMPEKCKLFIAGNMLKLPSGGKAAHLNTILDIKELRNGKLFQIRSGLSILHVRGY